MTYYEIGNLLLFFDPRYLAYYQQYIFVILRACLEHSSGENHVSKFDIGPSFNLMSKNEKIFVISS